MEKIANPTRTSQAELDTILEIPNRRARSRAILEHTRRQMAESRTRVQAMLLADGFTPRSLRQAMRSAWANTGSNCPLRPSCGRI